jgi:YbbR domain-containing protein
VSFKQTILNNIGWKIGGVVLALMLWTHLATEKTYEKDFTAEVEYTGLQDGLYVEKIEPPETDFTVVGTGKQLAVLAFSDKPKIMIDLSSVKGPGVFKYDITPLDIYPLDPYKYAEINLPSSDYCNFFIKRKI